MAELIQPFSKLGGRVAQIGNLPGVVFCGEDMPTMTTRYLRLAVAVVASLQLAACYTDFGPVEVGTGSASLSGAGVASRLQPGEKLKITVYGEESLTGEYDVNPAGYVTMPLIGSIKAAGHSQVGVPERTSPVDISAAGSCRIRTLTVAVVQFSSRFTSCGEATTVRASTRSGAASPCTQRSPWQGGSRTGPADPTSS